MDLKTEVFCELSSSFFLWDEEVMDMVSEDAEMASLEMKLIMIMAVLCYCRQLMGMGQQSLS